MSRSAGEATGTEESVESREVQGSQSSTPFGYIVREDKRTMSRHMVTRHEY